MPTPIKLKKSNCSLYRKILIKYANSILAVFRIIINPTDLQIWRETTKLSCAKNTNNPLKGMESRRVEMGDLAD